MRLVVRYQPLLVLVAAKETTIGEEHMPGSPSLLHHVMQLFFLTCVGSSFHHTDFLQSLEINS